MSADKNKSCHRLTWANATPPAGPNHPIYIMPDTGSHCGLLLRLFNSLETCCIRINGFMLHIRTQNISNVLMHKIDTIYRSCIYSERDVECSNISTTIAGTSSRVLMTPTTKQRAFHTYWYTVHTVQLNTLQQQWYREIFRAYCLKNPTMRVCRVYSLIRLSECNISRRC